MKIKISEIELILQLLLNTLKENKGDEIILKNDYYWEILPEDLYNPYKKPDELTLGQLSDDIN